MQEKDFSSVHREKLKEDKLIKKFLKILGIILLFFITIQIIPPAHRRNMAVQYWAINDNKEMKRLIEIGADGLMTDRPDLIKEVLVEMGYSK